MNKYTFKFNNHMYKNRMEKLSKICWKRYKSKYINSGENTMNSLRTKNQKNCSKFKKE